jgi:hypothetical protein
MIRHRVSIPLALGVLTLTLACGKQPALDVQQQGETAPAPQAPAPEPAAGAPELISARAPAAGELPAGHPPTGALPADHPPLDAAAGTLELAPVAAEAGQGAAALAWTAPAGWVSEPPANTMRRAQYRVPGPGGEGECVVFYFGPGQGGDPQSNAERWASQFLGTDGQPATAQTASRTVNGIDVLFVEAAGTYQSGSMVGMGQGVPKPDWALLGAIARGPDANWFFKLTAPRATLEANRAAFEAMVGSLERGG